MADTSERSSGSLATPRDPVAAAPAGDALRDEPYRPLSLLAILGLSLAVVYSLLVLLGGLAPLMGRYPKLILSLLFAAPLLGAQVALLSRNRTTSRVLNYAGISLGGLVSILGLGGLIGFSGTNPWYVPNGMGWLLLAVAVLLCWFAQSRIQKSEGTLSGLSLARWGMGLSLFFGLMYSAYLASSTFAIRSQAKQCVEEFLQTMQKTDDPESLQKAYLLSLPQRSRPTSDFRRAIEIEHNNVNDPRSRNMGMFSRFRFTPFALFLRQGPNRIVFDRLSSTSFDRGEHKMSLIYRVDGPLGDYDIQVGTIGSDVTDATGTRRQWHVDLMNTAIIRAVNPNAEGKVFENSARTGFEIAGTWCNRLQSGQVGPAFLDTLPYKERIRQLGAAALTNPGLVAMAGLALPGAWGSTPDAKDDFIKGIKEFGQGAILDTSSYFCTNEDMRKETVAEVKKILSGQIAPGSEFRLVEQAALPQFKPNGEASEFSYLCRIFLRDPTGKKKSYFVEAEVVVVGPLSARKDINTAFRVAKLRLIRAQVAMDVPLEKESRGGAMPPSM